MIVLRKNKSQLIISLLICFTIIFNMVSSQETTTSTEEQIPRDADFDDVSGIRLRHIDGIEKLLNETDMTYFAYYYKRSSPNSRMGAQFLKEISRKLMYLAQIIMIDCDVVEPKDTPLCQKPEDAEDGFPKMLVYTPPEYKINPYTKKVNSYTRKLYDSREVSENSIYNFITQNIISRSTKLNTENFENFVNNQEFNKVILFTDKKKTPLLFRGLSNFFYDRLIFGEVDKEQTALIKKFKVTKYPTLILYQSHEDGIPLDEPNIEIYRGEVKADEIASFIGPYALTEPFSKKAQSSDPESLKYKVIFKNLNKDDFLNYITKFNKKRFVIYLNDGKAIPDDVNQFNKMTNGFFLFVNINCANDTETENFCFKTFQVDELPSLVLYKNKENDMKASLEKPPVYLPLDYQGIEREMYKEYYGNLKEGNPQTFNALTNEAKINKKIPFIYLHEGDIPLSLNLLATEEKYLKYIDFIVFEHPTKEFLHNVQVKKLPQLIVLLMNAEKSDQARVLTYNEELVYSRLGNFINQYFNTERSTKINQNDEEEKLDIPLIHNADTLSRYCIKGRKKLCLIGFLDGRSNKDSIKQFDNSIKILENVASNARKQNKPASFGWVNATCHTDLAANVNVNIESIPNLIAYVPSKNIYANLIGTFDEETILNFIDRVMQGRVSMNPITSEKFTLSDVKCEEIRDEIDLEDDESLREFIEEEKKKRADFEKERDSMDETKKGKKKKRKNKKSEL